jgi:enoyl-CoA hydratase
LIRVDRHDHVSVVRIDRHEQRNALDSAHARDLLSAVDAAVAVGSRAIVITGEGTSFCAGADLDAVHDSAFRDLLTRLLRRITAVSVPVIAAINGPAIGAGSQLAVACDLRVAAPTARFGVPAARLGVATDLWTVQRVCSLAGGGPARALLLGVDSISAERAHAVGLVDRMGGLDEALAWAKEISALAPLTLAYFKRALEAATHGDADEQALNADADACWRSVDLMEAAQARQEGRQPVFIGR